MYINDMDQWAWEIINKNDRCLATLATYKNSVVGYPRFDSSNRTLWRCNVSGFHEVILDEGEWELSVRAAQIFPFVITQERR